MHGFVVTDLQFTYKIDCLFDLFNINLFFLVVFFSYKNKGEDCEMTSFA